MQIKKFTMESYKTVLNLWKKSGIHVGSSDTKEQLEKMLQRNPNLFLIGMVDDRIIGVVIGGFDGRRGYVHHLAIDPDYQRKGYGKKLMRDLLNEFREMGVHKIHLFIEKYNEDVVEFYENKGWEIRDDLIMMSYIPDKKLYW